MDNVAWNVLVALGSGIVSSAGTTMTMRRAKHEDLDKRIDERACVLFDLVRCHKADGVH